MKFKTIYNLRLAGYLMTKGFVLMDISENRNGSGKKVFFFKQSTELEKNVNQWLQENTNIKIHI